MKSSIDTGTGFHDGLNSAMAEKDGRPDSAARSAKTGATSSKLIAALLADALRGATEYVTDYHAGRGAE